MWTSSSDQENALKVVNVLLRPGESLARLVLGEHFHHPVQDTALADRPALMGAFVLPGVEFPVDEKHADLQVALGDHLAAAILELVLATHIHVSHLYCLLRQL